MPEWRCPIDRIKDHGIPYRIPLPEDNGPVRAPQAFLLRVEAPVPGSLAAWDDKGGHLVAFGNACTHMGCLLISQDGEASELLRYEAEGDDGGQRIVCGPCPCHGTSFDLTKAGLVILGPATQDLPQLALSRDGEDVAAEDWRADQDPRVERWPQSADEGDGA